MVVPVLHATVYLYIIAHGIYQFETYVMGYETSRDNTFIIMKNGVELCRALSQRFYPYSQGVCVATTEMQAGDQVYVEGTGVFHGDYWNGFSGFQIKAL